jgi:MFS transporter, NNP family, nitrate/nitrite transporter
MARCSNSSRSISRRKLALTGLVGAMGGRSGFFPPLLLGILRDRLGIIWPGFVLLALTSIALGIVNGRAFLRHAGAQS